MSETKTVVTTIERIFNPNEHGWADIKTADGKFSTKKPAIIGQARQFEDGRPVAVDYVERVKGQYTNRYAEAFRAPAADEVSPALNGTEYDGQQPEEYTPIPGVNVQTATRTNPRSEFQRSKEEMRRTEALKIAATILGPGTGTVALGLKADEIEALIQEKA